MTARAHQALRIILLPLLALLALPTLAFSADLSDTQKVTLRVKPAVVYVQVTVTARPALIMADSTPRIYDPISISSSGSGFIINPDGYIITNGHVVADYLEAGDSISRSRLREAALERDIYPFYRQQRNGRELTPSEKRQINESLGSQFQLRDYTKSLDVALSNWSIFPAEIKKYSPAIQFGGKDIAILKIESHNLPTVRLGDSDKVKLQDAVFPVGYPAPAANPLLSRSSMLEATITNGTVSALKFDLKGTPVIQTNAVIAPGSSGGPAFNSDGEVIGVSTFGTVDQTTGGMAAGFYFLVPINTAKEFVRESGIENQSGLFDKVWDEALRLYDAGKYRSAMAKLDEALSFLKDQPDALRLRQSAQVEIEQHPLATFLREWGWVLLTVLAVVVVGGIVLWYASSRKAKPVPGSARPSSVVAPPMTPKVVSTGAPVGAPVAGAPSPSARAFGSLVCTVGQYSGRRFEIDKKGLLIGRDGSKCQIVLTDDSISKEHVWVVPLENKVYAIDRGSSNGTYINSANTPPVSKIEVRHGDQILLGKKGVATFTFQGP